MSFDRFEGVTGKPPRGLDIKKTYFGSFPEFEEKTRNAGMSVYPIFEEGKPIIRHPVTVLESKEVKDRHAQIKAELGLTGTGKNLRAVKKAIVESKPIDDVAGDIRYYQEQLGIQVRGWEEI